VGGERVHRRGAKMTVLARIVGGELALPDVHAVLAGGGQLVPPRKALLLQSAARRVLPLGLRRQAHAGPAAVGAGGAPGDGGRGGGPRARRGRSVGPRGGASRRPRPAATRASERRRASAGSRRAAGRRRRTTSRSAPRQSRGPWPLRTPRSGRWRRRGRRSR